MTALPQNLASAVSSAGSAVALLRNAQARPTVFPVAPEFSNWRSEQQSWRESVALLDQSHHMTDLFLRGSDALRLLRDLAVNSFENFTVDRAKQFIAVNHEGFLIGDAILFHLEKDYFDLVGHSMAVDWVQYQLESGDYDVTAERDGNSIVRPGPPRLYRYELQGPNALALVEKAIGGEIPAVKFFHMTSFSIAGVRVRALRHGMAGQPGFELFGPWEEGERVRDALLAAGADLGVVPVGSMGYSSANLESGWVPSPLPAIFSGHGMDDYAAWLGAERAGSLAGSFSSNRIDDYYVTPYDLDYGRSVAFDHDFIGRAALERHAENQRRRKVTLVWNADDVAAAIGSLFIPGLPAKYLSLPKSRYGLYQADTVLSSGTQVGLSMDCGYMANEQVFASLATIDVSAAAVGTELTVIWGEEPNSSKPQVERHRQVEIRATVAPAPYVQFARSSYRDR
ncbi:aminomethyl transferase family protein [Cryobacterium sp. Hh7]|uniref:aminomethyl transferase family protein n=1 Tax=Cryobacterium sp. Hh7 TaxID=1259159 RepID=UPI001F541F3C|nr:aminomethyl transferase family protein [Cryobacterium sp. Hh7]